VDVGRVGDRPEIVHPLLGRPGTEGPVGQAGPALVEHDEPTEGREPFECPVDPGHVPHQLDVRDEPRNEHDVPLAAPDRLVGDAQIAALRVAGLRHLEHARKPNDVGVEAPRRLASTDARFHD
jgi:hypothetical protein